MMSYVFLVVLMFRYVQLAMASYFALHRRFLCFSANCIFVSLISILLNSILVLGWVEWCYLLPESIKPLPLRYSKHFFGIDNAFGP